MLVFAITLDNFQNLFKGCGKIIIGKIYDTWSLITALHPIKYMHNGPFATFEDLQLRQILDYAGFQYMYFTEFLYARLKSGMYYAVAMSVRPSIRPSVRPSVRVFRTFLQHALRYQFETWYIHSVGGTTCRVWVASQLGHFDLVHSQK